MHTGAGAGVGSDPYAADVWCGTVCHTVYFVHFGVNNPHRAQNDVAAAAAALEEEVRASAAATTNVAREAAEAAQIPRQVEIGGFVHIEKIKTFEIKT